MQCNPFTKLPRHVINLIIDYLGANDLMHIKKIDHFFYLTMKQFNTYEEELLPNHNQVIVDLEWI